jgi:NitT/TauT family transport system substrate-binding protein
VKLAKKLSIVLILALLASGCATTVEQTEDESALSQSSVEPMKLPNKTVLKVSSAGNFEFMTALYVADALGELEKENIFIEYVTLPSQDAIPALALGQVDVSVIGISATLFNAVADGADVRLVFPGPSSPNGDGLWVSNEFLAKPNTMEPMRIANSQGPAWLGVVPVGRYLERMGMDWNDVEFQKLPISELGTALELGSVDAAWLNSPAHLTFEEQGSASLVAQYSQKEVATGFAFGPKLLRNNPEIGQAFIRAMIRTIQTHLGAGYKSNPQIVTALANFLKISGSQISGGDELDFSFELDSTLQTNAQQIWINYGDILSYTEPLTPEEYIDLRFARSIEIE